MSRTCLVARHEAAGFEEQWKFLASLEEGDALDEARQAEETRELGAWGWAEDTCWEPEAHAGEHIFLRGDEVRLYFLPTPTPATGEHP